MNSFQVARWRRYGHDRLYVTGPDDIKVGWWDLKTDEGHPENPENFDVLTAAVVGWKANQDVVDPQPAPEAVVEPDEEPVSGKPDPVFTPESVEENTNDGVEVMGRPWVDLALNRPGESARDEALRARAAAPVKTTVARVLGVHTPERAWRIGADGEELVAKEIKKAQKKDPRWHVLHAVPVGDRGSDIDHVLIGPGGVFTVNAKHHPKAKIWVGGNTVMVNGSRQQYVRNSRFEAERAARMLSAVTGNSVYVEGLIVTVNAADMVVKSQPAGVTVTWRNNLVKWMLSLGTVLDDETIEAVYDAARKSTTWTP